MKRPIWLAFLFLLPFIGYTQETEISGNINSEIPVDPDIRIGTLDNGLKYYIRKNDKPQDKLELRLVVNVGSTSENEDQLGLAHFMEHMAFNGTKNFEKNELVSYLQTIGVKFGADLNAYTSFDETVYILPIPSGDEEILNQGFQVLEDWAHNVTLSDEEIEKERGVVIEEWRRGQGAGQRMRDEYFPILFKDSRYAKRLPIGTKESLEKFDPASLREFYKKWYRPDLMAVVAVGDVDVARIEAKIKDHFSGIENPKAEHTRELYEVPNHDQTFISVVTDKEAQFTQIQLIYKQELKETETVGDFRRDAVYALYNGMLSRRLNELRESSDPPFLFASSSYTGLVRTKSAYASIAVVGQDGIERGLKTLVRENERVKKYGFTEGELDRYKSTMLNQYESAYKEKDKTESARYANEYIRNFLQNEPIPGIGYEYEFYKQVLPSIELGEVNAIAEKFVTDENRVVIVMAPEKEGVVPPTREEVLAYMTEADAETIEPYADKEVASAFIDVPPSPGEIAETKEMANVDATELTLSNGVRVVLKPTSFKNDEVLIRALSLGGRSLYPENDDPEATNASDVVEESGVKEFSPSDISKMLSGKTVQVSPFVGTYNEGINGQTTPEDIETALQLINLYFVDPRKDRESFASYVNKSKMLLQNLMANPQFYYSEELNKILTQDNPRRGGFPTVEDLESIDYDRAYAIYKERFADAGDFVFFFVGSFDPEELKPMLETYLGSLPSSGTTENYRDLGIRPPAGELKKVITKGSDEKSMVTMVYTGDANYDLEEDYYLTSLGEVARNKLLDELREEKGGVYSVSASGGLGKIPYENYSFRVTFQCSPDNVDELINSTHSELEKIKNEGVEAEDLQKIKEAQRRQRKEDMEKNTFWLNTLYNSYYYNIPLERVNNFNEKIDALTSETLKETANKYLKSQNYIQVVLMPEEN